MRFRSDLKIEKGTTNAKRRGGRGSIVACNTSSLHAGTCGALNAAIAESSFETLLIQWLSMSWEYTIYCIACG